MQDFVKTYANHSATTEDFKAMVEKHMTQEMDLDGNRKMDWFFNEYVYGTALPKYNLESSFENGADGDVVWSFKLTQSGVDDNFKMLIPLYLQLADGRTMPLGRANLKGNGSLTQKVPLKGLKDKPRGALVNYNYDVLAEK
jgi:aminopeptidase N